MSAPEFLQVAGVIVSLLVVLERILNDIRQWRGGSPELRLIKEQLVGSNDKIYSLLQRVIDRLNER